MSGSPPDLLVLLDLRLTGVAESGVVAERTGVDLGVVERLLLAAESDGLVRRSGGTFGGFRLTGDGRRAVGRLLRAELDSAGVGEEVEEAYGRFLAGNQPFLDLCTRWQLRPADRELGRQPGRQPGREVINDHTDPAHDRAVLADLATVHARVRPVADDLGRLLDRFAPYGRRLDYALARLRGGELDWFTRPGIDSYHSVWFELHANLLATLGIERPHERSD